MAVVDYCYTNLLYVFVFYYLCCFTLIIATARSYGIIYYDWHQSTVVTVNNEQQINYA